MEDPSVGKCFTLLSRRIDSKWPSGKYGDSIGSGRSAAFNLGQTVKVYDGGLKETCIPVLALIPNRALAPFCCPLYATPWAGFSASSFFIFLKAPNFSECDLISVNP